MINKKIIGLKFALGVSFSCSIIFFICSILVFIIKLPTNGLWIGVSSIAVTLGTIMDFLLLKLCEENKKYEYEILFVLLFKVTVIGCMFATNGNMISAMLFFIGYYTGKSFANSLKCYKKSIDYIKKEAKDRKHIEMI